MSKLFFPISIWLLIWVLPIYSTEPVTIVSNANQIKSGKTDFYLDKNISDGPYIFYEGKNIVAKWIENDSLVSEIVTEDNIEKFKTKFNVFPEYSMLVKKKYKRIGYKQDYQDIEMFIALSDIHGQYNLFVDLLKVHKVVDDNGNWIFGENHLVINGDIFDRADGVTESLWMIYQLTYQAEEEGGKVHLLIGNHEAMILEKDFRYLHSKYLRTAQLMDTTYDYLYSEQTIIGQWIRNIPIMITINNILITHAGISPKFIDYKLTPKKANKIFLNYIIGKPWDLIQNDSVLEFLNGADGPLWYRGYFNKTELNEEQLDMTLDYLKKDHIIVGNTSQESVTSLFNGKVFAIDSSIKLGKSGEVLIYEKGEFYRGTLAGQKIKL